LKRFLAPDLAPQTSPPVHESTRVPQITSSASEAQITTKAAVTSPAKLISKSTFTPEKRDNDRFFVFMMCFYFFMM